MFHAAEDSRAAAGGNANRAEACGRAPRPPTAADLDAIPVHHPKKRLTPVQFGLIITGAVVGVFALAAVGLMLAGAAKAVVSNRAQTRDTMPLLTFQATTPGAPQLVTVDCKLAASQRYHDSDPNETLWVELEQDEPSLTLMNGYADRTSSVGRRLFNILKDGRTHTFQLEMRFDPDYSTDDAEIVGIKD